MAVKGTIAKEKVENIIKEAFGSDYIGAYDKKLYVWADDGGERVQISLALTCPKTQVGVVSADSQGYDFAKPTAAPSTFQPAEFGEEEKDNIYDLMKALNL